MKSDECVHEPFEPKISTVGASVDKFSIIRITEDDGTVTSIQLCVKCRLLYAEAK